MYTLKSLNNKFALNKNLAVLATMASMWACSHSPAIQEFPNTASANDELSKFESDMNAAAQNQVDVLSPQAYKSAERALKDAKRSLDSQKNDKVTLHAVAKGRAYLNRANGFADLSHSNLHEVIIARKAAIDAGAQASQKNEFRKADARLINSTEDIENNRLESAVENRSDLQLKYMDIELAAIKHAKLGRAQDIVAQSKKEGATEFAPRTLAVTQKSIQETDAFITANRRNSNQINSRSNETLRRAEHLLKITRNSKSGKKTSSEETALQMENEQIKVAAGQALLTDKEQQLDLKDQQLDRNQKQIASSENANQALKDKNENLESEQALNRLYEEARSGFTRNEAEVYKQGNTLMIRLRGLEFPVSEAALKGSNFPLLAKVQKVIKGFGNSTVIVEGHTDSNGGKELNKKLSTLRAEAVKEYFVANQGDQSLNIRSIGYDYQKPLSTNKTASGRAQNRRVDILIQPDSFSEASEDSIRN